MAPIQTYSSFANQSSTLNMAPRVCHCGGILKDGGEYWLPISRRGHFFHDSFFENVHSYFDSAIREILNKWSDAEVLGEASQCSDRSPSTFGLYRQLRSRDHREDQASTIVSDDRTHKVVVDVQDFMEGDIKVKVLGEKEVVVEGQGNGSPGEGSFSSRRFCRRFTFPSSVNMADVTSVLSSDGVLTIEAPKMEAVSRREVSEESSASSSESVPSISSSVSETSDIVYYCKGCNKKIGGSWQTAPETKTAQQGGVKVPININASMSSALNSQTDQISTEKKEQIKSVKKETMAKNTSLQGAETTDGETNVKLHSQVKANHYEVPVTTAHSFLPVSIRGPFFGDSFFSDLHKDFQSAVQEVLSRWGARTSMRMEDDLSAYRKLRLGNLKEETQAVQTREDESSYKFVLDVQDFVNGGDITLKVINDSGIVVEGHIEKEEGGSKSLKHFMKQFRVPGNIRLDSVSSVMSSDGVLTVTVPKSVPIQPKEVIIPVNLEGIERSQTCHVSSTLLDDHDLVFGINADSISGTNHSEMQSKVRPSNEHIIPITVEGCFSNPETSRPNCEIQVQKESSESLSGLTNQEQQKDKVGKEYIIPVNVEGSACNLKSEATESKIKVFVQNPRSQHRSNDEQAQKNQITEDRIIPIIVERTADSAKAEVFKHQQIHEHQITGERIIPVTVEGSSSDVKANTFDHQIKVQKGTFAHKNANQHSEQAQETTEDQKNRTNESSFMKHMKENADTVFKRSDMSHFAHPSTQVNSDAEKNIVSNQHSNDTATSSTKRYLPVSRKGSFLEDMFFKDFQNDFQAAVKDVLVKCRQCFDMTDYMTAYRNLRQKELKVENQALYAQEDQESLKIAVDAKDFINGDITVFVDGEELVIEGKAENSEARSSNSLTFSHRFLLPESFSITTISSAISSDGILTVQCPKRKDASSEGIRRMSTEASSHQESRHEGGHKWEEKRVKESSEQASGYSSRTYSSSYSSRQRQTSTF
uniref:HSP21 n=1 Tax=Macrobrachium nipponense TaxID=159736 RepID=A0A7U3RZD0_MACNP|nr:HSP21 [Macrobrachium nipponense]